MFNIWTHGDEVPSSRCDDETEQPRLFLMRGCELLREEVGLQGYKIFMEGSYFLEHPVSLGFDLGSLWFVLIRRHV